MNEVIPGCGCDMFIIVYTVGLYEIFLSRRIIQDFLLIFSFQLFGSSHSMYVKTLVMLSQVGKGFCRKQRSKLDQKSSRTFILLFEQVLRGGLPVLNALLSDTHSIMAIKVMTPRQSLVLDVQFIAFNVFVIFNFQFRLFCHKIFRIFVFHIYKLIT